MANWGVKQMFFQIFKKKKTKKNVVSFEGKSAEKIQKHDVIRLNLTNFPSVFDFLK